MLTCNVTWVLEYDSQSKHPSGERLSAALPKKDLTEQVKVILIAFSHIEEVVYQESVREGKLSWVLST